MGECREEWGNSNVGKNRGMWGCMGVCREKCRVEYYESSPPICRMNGCRGFSPGIRNYTQLADKQNSAIYTRNSTLVRYKKYMNRGAPIHYVRKVLTIVSPHLLTQGNCLGYNNLPVQYTELTHRLRKILIYTVLS